MATPENRALDATPNQALSKSGETTPVEFIELGLALELVIDTHPVFAEAVKAAVEPMGGELLFELPYGTAPDSKGRVAAVRLSYAGQDEPRVAFVFLSDDAMDTKIEPADKQVEHLRDFARSFVDVLEQIGRQ